MSAVSVTSLLGPPSKQPARSMGPRRGFDVDACENDELLNLVIEGAIRAGHPYVQSVFTWACTNKSHSARVRERVQRRFRAVRDVFEEWRKCYLVLDSSRAALDAHRAAAQVDTTAPEPLPDGADAMAVSDHLPAIAKLKAKHTEDGQVEGVVRTSLLILLCELLGDRGAQNLLKFVDNAMAHLARHRDHPRTNAANRLDHLYHNHWAFNFDWIPMVHAIMQRCMICRNRCALAPPHPDTLVAKNRWHFAVEQSDSVLYTSHRCVESSIVVVQNDIMGDPLKYFHNLKPHLGGGAARMYQTAVLAKAMLHQADIYETQGNRACEALGYKVGPAFNRPLFLYRQPYVRDEFTLEGRLGLTLEQVRAAAREAKRCTTMHQQERDAAQMARVNKLCGDCDQYLQRHLPGETLLGLQQHLPGLKGTLLRVLKHKCADPATLLTNASLGQDALENRVARALLQRVVYAIRDMGPLDRSFVGPKGHSSEAYEYVFNLCGGRLPGPPGPWREQLDFGTMCLWTESPVLNNYLVAAMHIFDGLADGTWSMTMKVASLSGSGWSSPPSRRVLVWVLEHATLPIQLAQQFKQSTHDCLERWHQSVTDAFDAMRKSTRPDLSSDLLPRLPISNKVFLGAFQLQHEGAMADTAAYFNTMAGASIMFPEMRSAGLLLAGIYPRAIASELALFHDRWAEGRVTVPGQDCLCSATDLVHWICGNPMAVQLQTFSSHGESRVASDTADGPSAKRAKGNEWPVEARRSYHPSSPQYGPGVDGEDGEDGEASD